MRIKSHIPNMFTLFNLSLGVLSIINILAENYFLAALLILLAALMDRFDGKLARKFDAESDLGKELDSLCDLISFGVAPAILIWASHLIDYGVIGMAIIILFPIAGAYRLARYNVTEFEGVYMGIPITVSGGIVALVNLYSMNYNTSTYFLIFMMMFLSYSMVSQKIKLKKR
ncbi:CDP-diacylglycerol--serine O-phosphatidyltransferase [Alkaliphilus sp. MSJ-5]|uniref:CDP-diacylglycerol--serine O-phosphatidyltransferase n=1 Tax=Alkaliphilus flagellatus TaxID=2841507 RepID=A0ABS6G1K2_9FIRM|nr:CDP-diacylglycerol--serine O-phosphatidyltransferase [Alkaliphilus flagellatus]MBU5675255.1 CDP-diacylglycerol--serine O-phosphatidyltransferase [Alkaliphilus flagellatus]